MGRIVYTPWLNVRGGIDSGVTLARTGDEESLVITATVHRIRDLAWSRMHAQDARRVFVTDVSLGYVWLSVMGPRSRLADWLWRSVLLSA
ncbi:hypothetical protein [Bradyrhizobium sp. USDA 4510]